MSPAMRLDIKHTSVMLGLALTIITCTVKITTKFNQNDMVHGQITESIADEIDRAKEADGELEISVGNISDQLSHVRDNQIEVMVNQRNIIEKLEPIVEIAVRGNLHMDNNGIHSTE